MTAVTHNMYMQVHRDTQTHFHSFPLTSISALLTYLLYTNSHPPTSFHTFNTMTMLMVLTNTVHTDTLTSTLTTEPTSTHGLLLNGPKRI